MALSPHKNLPASPDPTFVTGTPENCIVWNETTLQGGDLERFQQHSLISPYSFWNGDHPHPHPPSRGKIKTDTLSVKHVLNLEGMGYYIDKWSVFIIIKHLLKQSIHQVRSKLRSEAYFDLKRSVNLNCDRKQFHAYVPDNFNVIVLIIYMFTWRCHQYVNIICKATWDLSE